MVIVDYYQPYTCNSTYSTTASSYVGPTNATTSCTCSRCRSNTYTTYTNNNNDEVEVEEIVEIKKNKWPKLQLEIKPKVQILDNKPFVRHRQLLFSKSGWLLSKGKLKRRGY